jgi:hypothetical protein
MGTNGTLQVTTLANAQAINEALEAGEQLQPAGWKLMGSCACLGHAQLPAAACQMAAAMQLLPSCHARHSPHPLLPPPPPAMPPCSPAPSGSCPRHARHLGPAQRRRQHQHRRRPNEQQQCYLGPSRSRTCAQGGCTRPARRSHRAAGT